MTGEKIDWKQPWVIRKAVYCVMAFFSLVGIGFGFINQAQADQLWAHVDEVIQVVSVVVLMVAASKTGAHSDLKPGAGKDEAFN